ncbi:hypothetical protein V1511DRAFT_455014 [Dipodascopsis uninucleata]
MSDNGLPTSQSTPLSVINTSRSSKSVPTNVLSQSPSASIQRSFEKLSVRSPGSKENKISPRVSGPRVKKEYQAPLEDILSQRLNSAGGSTPGKLTFDAVEESFTKPLPHKRRLVITHLVLDNFKSYAGHQVIGPFHSSFSAVVGPNGSGKSNVIDSLLFVFGFRAAKMRQAKISALIHNSATYSDLKYCSVEVHFEDVIDNDTGTSTPVPNSKIVVSRRAYKNNSSKYFINESESNYAEVTTLLRNRGIDLDHKRFLILQGEVESIAQMKPKAQNENDDGLLEYLEDIIGTSKYKQPIEETAQQIEYLNEQVLEKESRLGIVKREKESLEEARKQALTFINDENELVLKKSTLYQLYIYSCQQSITVTNEIVEELKLKLKEESSTYKENERDIMKLEEQCQELSKDLERLKTESRSSNKAHAKFERDIVHLTEKKKHISAKREKIAKTIATSKLAVNSSSGWMANYDEEMSRLHKEIRELEDNLSKEESIFEDIKVGLEGKTRDISDQIEAKKGELEPWKQKINAKVSDLDVTKSELRMILDKKAHDQELIAEQESKIKSTIASGRSKESEVQELKTELQHVQEQIQLGEGECEGALQKLSQLKEKSDAARHKAEEARQAFVALQNQDAILNSLQRLSDTGRVHGFFGRLGDLGAIDEKYDVAISTACPSLNNLVVENVETGQACIEYLRKNNLGRAKFILLNQLKKRDTSALSTPENAPRLFDLVRPKDPKFSLAFYSVLQDTLVANDLAQANRIAYGRKRWRVVTLDGKLIDMSGTMSGGGNRVSKGFMRSKLKENVSEKALEEAELKWKQLEYEYDNYEVTASKMEATLSSLKNSVPQIEIKISKTELEIEALSSHLHDLKRSFTEMKQELQQRASGDDTQAVLEQRIASLEKDLESLRSKTSSYENEIKGLEDQIMEIGGVKLRIQKSKVDGIQQQIDIRSEQINNAELAKVKSEKESGKQQKSIKNAQTEMQEVEEELAQVTMELEKVQNMASEAETVANSIAYALEEKQDEMKSLTEDLNKRRSEMNKFKKAEVELLNALKSREKELLENQSKVTHWTDKLASLSLHDIQVDDLPLEIPTYSEDELLEFNKEQLKSEIAILEEKSGKARVDLGVLAEYRRREEEESQRDADMSNALVKRKEIKQKYEDLRKRRSDEFMAGFNAISIKLKEMYQMITMGGNAELELVDSLDPFSEGILFSVMPPKKSWRNISNLSGGEKTLSSLALVFALHHFKPTPLYVMDEIDAALDFRNVSIVANYIKERTKNAQFIVISLRNNMFELAKQLVGIYKVNHMTKSITMRNIDISSVINENHDSENIQSS